MRMRTFAVSALLLWATGALAQTAPPAPPASGMVTVSGTVPDEATKADVLDRLRKLYGTDHVVDQVEVGGVVTPANWKHYVVGMIGPNLKQVSHGQVQVQGNTIEISGEIPNEAVRQQVLSSLSSAFDSHYAIKQNLRIGSSTQKVLDDALADRIVEFQSGSAILTAQGRSVLDGMAAAMLKLNDPAVDIIGNTDDVGDRQSNIALSLARASATRAYLIGKGIPAASLSVSGHGPDQPIADNATDAGRARNRRIDFKLGKH